MVALEEARAFRHPRRRIAWSKAAPCTAGRRRIAVLSPYFPFPLSHGGAVRIYNLLREMAKQFDVELFAFTDGPVRTRARSSSSAPASSSSKSRAIASRAGAPSCRPKSTSSARPP